MAQGKHHTERLPWGWSRETLSVSPKPPFHNSQQGEKILKLAEICRKFETEEEKVLPFYSSVLTPEEQEEAKLQNPEDITEDLAKVEGEDVSGGSTG